MGLNYCKGFLPNGGILVIFRFLLFLIFSIFTNSTLYALCSSHDNSLDCDEDTNCRWQFDETAMSQEDGMCVDRSIDPNEATPPEEESPAPELHGNPNQDFYDNYNHQGTHQAAYRDACERISNGGNMQGDAEQIDRSHCNTALVDYTTDVWGGPEFGAMVQAAGALYSSFFGSQGISMKWRAKVDPADKKDRLVRSGKIGSEEKYNASNYEKPEDKPDICAFGPRLGEEAATAVQEQNQQVIEFQMQTATEVSMQKQALESLADLHDSRKKTSIIQGSAWGAATACYGAYLIGGAEFNGMMATKMATTAFMSIYYFSKADKHGDQAKIIRQEATSMPSLGTCGPDNPECFCADASTEVNDPENYVRYCIPPAMQSNYNYIPCYDAQFNPDPECKCKATNTCYDGTSNVAGATFDGSITGAVNPLFQTMSTGAFDNQIFRRKVRSAVKKAKKLLASPKAIAKLPSTNLSKSEKKLAQTLHKHGIPAQVAAVAAGFPLNKKYLRKFNKKNKTNFKKDDQRFLAMIRSRRPKGKSRRAPAKNYNFSTPQFGKKPENKGGVKIAKQHSRKITNRAEIHWERDNRLIFEIISNRYKLSAWNRLD
jgi:hypothetical protein